MLGRESAVLEEISPVPWQTDTCIGNWHYKVGVQYKTPKKVIDLLVDIVSKNGNLLLNFRFPAPANSIPKRGASSKGSPPGRRSTAKGFLRAVHGRSHGEGPAMLVKIDPNARYNVSKQPRARCLGHPLHHQRQDPLRLRTGLAARRGADPIPRQRKPAKGRPHHGRTDAQSRAVAEVSANRRRFTHHAPGRKTPATADLGVTFKVSFARVLRAAGALPPPPLALKRFR